MVGSTTCISPSIYAFGQAVCLGAGIIVGVFVVVFAQGIVKIIREKLEGKKNKN
jgi:hypothetical protein